MRRLQSFLSVILVLLVCGTAWAAEAANVSGTLVDAGGAPVAGAAVKLIYCEFTTGITGRAIGEVKTDAEGKFLFAGAYSWTGASTSGQLPPRFTLISTPPNSGVAYLNLHQGDGSEGLNLQAGPREVVSVTVADTEGKPVGDARVWLLHAMPGNLTAAGVKQMLIMPSDVGGGEKTNAEGKADVVVPQGTMAMIGVEKAGYALAMGAKEFTLHRGGTITGRVIGVDGKPVAGAKVTYAADAMQGFTAPAVVADGEGRFELKDVPAAGYAAEIMGRKVTGSGRVTITAALPTDAGESGLETVTLKPGETATKDIAMKAKLQVAGTVLNEETGQPLAGISLRMFSYPRQGGGSTDSRMAQTDEAGRFSFSVMPNYSVQINLAESAGGEYLVDQVWQRSTPGAMSGVNIENLTESKTDVKIPIRLRKLAPLAGKVVDSDGKPVAKATVSVDPMLRGTTTDAEGNFAFKGAPTDRAGEITVNTETLGALAPLTAGQAQITITALPLVSRDCIAQTPDGEPAGDLRFMLLQQGLAGMGMRQTSQKPNVTDAEGKCRLEGLLPGATYFANWGAAGEYGDGNTQFTVPADGAPIRLTARKYNKSFGVIVENEDGEPVRDARVQFNNMNLIRNDQWGKISNLKTDADGALRLEGMAGGPIEFQIHAPNFRWHQVSALVSDGEYLATLTRQQNPPHHIVVVRTSDGKPVADHAVRSFSRGAETPLKTDANGRIEMPVYDQQTDMTVLCQDAQLGWGVASLQSHQDGTTALILQKATTPRKVRLLTADGKPVANTAISVTAMSSRDSSGSGFANQSNFYGIPVPVQKELGLRQTTDANGVATFPSVDARLHASVRIESQEFGDQHKSLQENGSAAGDEIRIQKLATIAGAVILPPDAPNQPDGRNRYHVQAQTTNRMGGGQGASTNQDGWFEMKVEPGEYQLAVMSSGSSRYMVRTRPVVKVGPGEYKEVDVELKEGIAVRGKYIPKNGKLSDPLPKIGLRVDENMGISPRSVNADGSFEFFVPRPGDYVLYVQSTEGGGSFRPHRDGVKVPSEKAVEGLEIREE